MCEEIESNRINRRNMLKMAAGAGAVALTANSCTVGNRSYSRGVVNERINQSIAYWCFREHWDIEQFCRIAKYLGCQSIELIEPQYWPVLCKYGLVCAIHGSHGLADGMNNPKFHNFCIDKLRASIDECSQYGFPNVITFTGLRRNISDDNGIKNCVEGYKKIIGHAEKKKVNLCLDILNSRVDIELKGHPGYQGDHIDYCVEIARKVGSPRMKVLFDIYNIQIMDGDIISRIRQHKDYIGHYQIAGVPGRNEPNNQQEINYKPIMEEIYRTGYAGYVGHAFIPTGNPYRSLKEAVILCDV